MLSRWPTRPEQERAPTWSERVEIFALLPTHCPSILLILPHGFQKHENTKILHFLTPNIPSQQQRGSGGRGGRGERGDEIIPGVPTGSASGTR
jgi:hypothetical protein